MYSFKNYTLLGGTLYLLLLLLVISGCSLATSSDSKDDEYRQIAWNSLSSDEKETVIHDLNEAVVDRDDTFRPWSEGEEAQPIPSVSVRFNTKDDALLGPIVIYINPDTDEILGVAPRY